jgi:hypothetical protein
MASIDSGNYLINLVSSTPYLGQRLVEITDVATHSAIPAEIFVSAFTSITAQFSLRDCQSKTLQGDMVVMAYPGEPVYVKSINNMRQGITKHVGSQLLDHAFLLGEKHASQKGVVGLTLNSMQMGAQPDPAVFYLKYGMLPERDVRPKYYDFGYITKRISLLDRQNPNIEMNLDVLRAKQILSTELNKEEISTEEVYEKWWWDVKDQPTFKLSEQILNRPKGDQNSNTIIPMELPPQSIEKIRARLGDCL